MKQQGTLLLKIVIPIFFVAIVVYLIFSAWAGMRNPYPTVICYTDTLEEGVDASGWVVRSEEPVAATPGLVQIKRNEGEKVGVHQPIAVIYQDEQYMEHQQEILRLNEALTEQQYATGASSLSGTALDEQVLSALKALKTSASSGNYSDLDSQAKNYRKLVLRREYLYSGDTAAELAAASATLNEQLKALEGYQTGTNSINADQSGVFSTHLDGYETLLTPESLKVLAPEDAQGFDALKASDVEGDLGKVITSSTWYYAVTVPEDAAGKFSVGSSLKVRFDALSDQVPMQVQSVSQAQNGIVAVVLSSSKNLSDTMSLRRESGRVIFRSSTGIRVPKAALRVDKEDEIGVFTVSAYAAKFKAVTILAEGEDYYLLEANPSSSEDKRILRTGDEVILASADLYDGKVVR